MPELIEINRRFAVQVSPERLAEAFTHRSFAVEHQLNYDNQRLEFLGDAVLEIIVSDYLFARYPDSAEGDLTKIRSALACEGALAKLAREYDLGSYLRIGRGEAEAHGMERESTLADLFEAFAGAIYLDCGIDAARKYVMTVLEKCFPEPHDLLYEINPKGKLQEFSQQKWNETPDYQVLHLGGPQHCPCYEVEVTLHKFNAVGWGKSRKIAESEAAKKLLGFLRRQGE